MDEQKRAARRPNLTDIWQPHFFLLPQTLLAEKPSRLPFPFSTQSASYVAHNMKYEPRDDRLYFRNT